MSILQPYIDSGKLVVKSGQTNFPEQVGTLRWDGAVAQARMDDLLATYYTDEPRRRRPVALRRHLARHHRRR